MSVFHHAQGDEPGSALGTPFLYNLVYCSRAASGVDDAAVADIIDASRRHNPREGITGLLVFGGGIFFQWLEGPRDNVTHLMHRLSKDVRHDTIIALSESEEVRERLFPDWDMELVSGGDIREVLSDALDAAGILRTPRPCAGCWRSSIPDSLARSRRKRTVTRPTDIHRVNGTGEGAFM